MYRGRVLEVTPENDSFYMEFEFEGTTLGADFKLHLLPDVFVGDIVEFDEHGMKFAELGKFTAEDIERAKAEGARMAAEWKRLATSD